MNKQYPRGVRNCNPGNIRYNKDIDWIGQEGQDENGFCIFRSPQYGIRAMTIILVNYRRLYDLHTLREYINRWCVGSPVTMKDYLDYVERETGLKADQDIDLGKDLPKLVMAIIYFENGYMPYKDITIFEGISMGLYHFVSIYS